MSSQISGISENAELYTCAPAVSEHRMQGAGLRLGQWVEEHLYRFQPQPCTDIPLIEQVKPLGELLLILFSLRQPAFSSWAQHLSARLWDFMQGYAASIPWKNMKSVVAERPDAAIPLMMIPLMEALAGKESRFHDDVRQVVSNALHSAREASMDVRFAGDIGGFSDCIENSCKWLQDEITILRRDGAATSSTLYAITHAIFYATRMGHRPLALLKVYRLHLAGQLVRLAKHRFAMADYDLGSELLLAAWWTYPEEPVGTAGDHEMLTEIAESEGSIPPYPKLFRESADAFENRYHPTLTALAVLAESTPVTENSKGDKI